MPKLFDITNWNEQPWFSTGGTRSKKYVQDPSTGKYHYYKRSYKTTGRDYFFEFWSEVVASEVGLLLGFDMLQYDIAINGDEMGCISESMILPDSEQLIEGGQYLQAVDLAFTPEVRALRNRYSFQLLMETLDGFGLSDYITHIIEMIVFDALIGNGDRHQENWAFINANRLLSGILEDLEKGIKSGSLDEIPEWLKRTEAFKKLFDLNSKEIRKEAKILQLFLQETKRFAPIYDSGSSLGRELTDSKVMSMLRIEQEFEAYVNRGVAEIHWGNKKVSHWELITKLLESSYCEITTRSIQNIQNKFDRKRVDNLIFAADKEVPEHLKRFKLPAERKHLMFKLITSRYERLKQLCDERV